MQLGRVKSRFMVMFLCFCVFPSSVPVASVLLSGSFVNVNLNMGKYTALALMVWPRNVVLLLMQLSGLASWDRTACCPARTPSTWEGKQVRTSSHASSQYEYSRNSLLLNCCAVCVCRAIRSSSPC